MKRELAVGASLRDCGKLLLVPEVHAVRVVGLPLLEGQALCGGLLKSCAVMACCACLSYDGAARHCADVHRCIAPLSAGCLAMPVAGEHSCHGVLCLQHSADGHSAADASRQPCCVCNTELPGTLQLMLPAMACCACHMNQSGILQLTPSAGSFSSYYGACRLELDRHELLRRSHDCLGLATMDAPAHDDPFTLAPPPGYMDRGHHDKEVRTPLQPRNNPKLLHSAQRIVPAAF